jgi:predicted transcriptional regulator
MAQIAEEKEIITVNAENENHSQARFASLDKNIIEPLVKQWGFIEVEKIGRNRWIKITQEGIDASEFLT